jgi:uncharacterized BrkB/YihY/UPF0761 family membrane protein
MKDIKQRFAALWEKRFRVECRAFVFDGCMNLSAALALFAILSLIPFLFLLIPAAA